jgi:hypothetical protein
MTGLAGYRKELPEAASSIIPSSGPAPTGGWNSFSRAAMAASAQMADGG